MKKYRIFFTIFSLIILVNCTEDLIPPTDQRKYPTELNNSWTYSTKMYEQYYDSLGSLSDYILVFSVTTIAKIVKLNDTVGNYNNLIQFISYDLSSPQSVEQMWYLNNEDGFYAIAYSNAGSGQPILPKGRVINQNEFLKMFLNNISMPVLFIDDKLVLNTDSILFYDSPRYVLKYPVAIGSRWLELSTPFHRDRVIKKLIVVTVPSGTFTCYMVSMESIDQIFSNLKFTDYISLDAGLVSRQIVFDSLAHTNEMGDTLGFLKSSITSELISH